MNHLTDIQARRIHALVRAEQIRRVESFPELCHWAIGYVSATARDPKPKWCVLKVNHDGSHQDETRRERVREQTRRRVERFRDRKRNA